MEDVSKFIVGMCQIHPKSNSDVLSTTKFGNEYQDQIYAHVLPCGSYVEFYIKPTTSCIDDFDTMMFAADKMAFTEDITVLPVDHSSLLDKIQCFRIEPYDDYPGFVKLRWFGEVVYDWQCKQFKLWRIRDLSRMGFYQICHTAFADVKDVRIETKGPALKATSIVNTVIDTVTCMWCPQWPKEAANWPYRHRNYKWPTDDTIQIVLSNGCHVVNAKHPECRDDKNQHRLSFSAAEVVLLQSWTPIQQIVYHLLRFFAKRELMKKDRPKEDEVLCTYHLKTLMLWSCEKMSPEWWNSYSVLELCHCLLMKLLEWLKKQNCPNYFIPHANLFHERMKKKIVDETTGRLNELCHTDTLSGWFAWNYIMPVIRRGRSLRDVLENVAGFGNWMLRFCEMMKAEKLKNFELQFSCGFINIDNFRELNFESSVAFGFFRNLMSYNSELTCKRVNRGSFPRTAEFSSSFPHYEKALYILRMADELRSRHITCDSQQLSENVKEFSWQPKVVLSRYHNFPKPLKTNRDRSWILFLAALDLMKNLNGIKTKNYHVDKLVAQLSKGLLRKAIYCGDLKSRSIRNAAFVYMAALHFSETNFEEAIDLCLTVLLNQIAEEEVEQDKKEKTKQEERETLNAACLFYIDDVVRMIGFYLLCIRIKNNLPYNLKAYLLDLRLTPEVFAYHLIIISGEKLPKALRPTYDMKAPTFPMDEILMTMSNLRTKVISKATKCVSLVYHRTDPVNQMEAARKSSLVINDDIFQLLMEFSLENMTSFYDTIYKDFGIQCNVVDCYRAAYLYNYRRYADVSHLCERILDEPDLQNDFKMLAFANIMVLPPLDLYFDCDIRCLLGFQTLFYYVSFPKTEHSSFSTLQAFFYEYIYQRKSMLHVVLLLSFSEKCHYFIGRHFLARYLKLRCMIDCNHSSPEAMVQFETLQSRLPFEHIMREFIRYKLRRHQNGT